MPTLIVPIRVFLYLFPNKRHYLSLLVSIFVKQNHPEMNKLNQSKLKNELKQVVKKSFEDMLHDVVKGKISIGDFTSTVQYNYTQKKIELSGSLF
jgi:hypothetical protein